MLRLGLGIALIAFNTCFSQDALPSSPGPVPVLVELFTSEGCSSCPPADRFLQSLDSEPIPGIQIIVLSEHVDYWNHDGWTDPYSSPDFSKRQSVYAHQFKSADVYTPQVVVDGWRQMSGNKPTEVEAALQEASSRHKAEMHITDVTVEKNRLHVQVEIPAVSLPDVRALDICLALALNHAESQVTRGENANRRLTHTAVVRNFKRLGKLTPGKPFSQAEELKIDGKTDPHGLRVVAFLQDPDSGKVFGAAMRKVGDPAVPTP